MSVLVVEPLFVVADYLAESLHSYAVFIGLRHCSKNVTLEVVVVEALHEVRLHVLLAHLIRHGGQRLGAKLLERSKKLHGRLVIASLSLDELFEVVAACLERLISLLGCLFAERLEQLADELFVAVAVAEVSLLVTCLVEREQ